MNLRELKYVLLGEDRLSGKLRQVSQSGDRAATSLMRSSDRLAKFKRNAGEAAREIPGVGRAMSLIKNPVAMGAAAVAGLAAGFKKATDAAAKFNSTFRELENLNLDKSLKDRGMLKGLVKYAASKEGFDLSATSAAFYDVQSVTGQYGGEVSKIVRSQGRFAEVMKADFNSWISGTAKAMANFGFGSESLDDFNRSAFAAVKVGVTSFDQLAKVQSVYAGAAASAKQNFDSANKVFAIFSKRTKSVDEAATLTKSLFNDLTKKTSIEALEKVVGSMYDVDGKVKQVDQIMLELNRKFIELGDQDRKIIDLKNEFQGSEGFIAMIQAATDQSGGLKKALDEFGDTKLDFEVALKLAEMDPVYMEKKMRDRLNTAWARVGEHLLPLRTGFAEFMASEAEAFRATFSGKSFGKEEAFGATMEEFDFIKYNATSMSDSEFKEHMKTLNLAIEKAYDEKEAWKKHPERFNPLMGRGRFNYGYWGGRLEMLNLISSTALQSRRKGIPIIDPNAPVPDPTQPPPDPNDPLQNGLNSVSGGGNQIRNITVNIAKLIESQNINTKNLTEGSPQIQQKVEEALIRAISGTEQMLAGQ